MGLSVAGRTLLLAVALLPFTGSGAAVAAAQPATLDSVRVRVVLSASGGSADIRVRYHLSGMAGDTVRLSAVPFFGLAVAGAEAVLDGRPARLAVERAASGAWVGRVAVAPGARVLEVRYTVQDAAAVRGERTDLRVPLPLPQGLSVASAETFFHAELFSPAGVHVIETFPTVADVRAPGSVAVHALTLPVAPGLLRWRLATGEAPRVTFAGAVDLSLVALLVLLAVLGVRALRRPVPEP